MKAVTVLFLAANPDRAAHLALGKESDQIEQVKLQSQHREQFNFLTHWAVTYNRLETILQQLDPDILHFSGHGTADGEIVLQTDNGSSECIGKLVLSRLFSLVKKDIQCIVLNACNSKVLAQYLATELNCCAIGIEQEIPDDTAIEFSISFYKALGNGYSLQDAVDMGRTRLDRFNVTEASKPELFWNSPSGKNPSDIFIFGARSPSEAPDERVPEKKPALSSTWYPILGITAGNSRYRDVVNQLDIPDSWQQTPEGEDIAIYTTRYGVRVLFDGKRRNRETMRLENPRAKAVQILPDRFGVAPNIGFIGMSRCELNEALREFFELDYSDDDDGTQYYLPAGNAPGNRLAFYFGRESVIGMTVYAKPNYDY